MTLAVMIAISVIAGFVIGKDYESRRIADLLLDLAMKHREDRERIDP